MDGSSSDCCGQSSQHSRGFHWSQGCFSAKIPFEIKKIFPDFREQGGGGEIEEMAMHKEGTTCRRQCLGCLLSIGCLIMRGAQSINWLDVWLLWDLAKILDRSGLMECIIDRAGMSIASRSTSFIGNINRRLSRWKQLGGLVPVCRLGVPLRCKAGKLKYPQRIPPEICLTVDHLFN